MYMRSRKMMKRLRPFTRKRFMASPSYRSSNKGSSLEREVICMFLEMLNTIKVYHWKTYSYPTHKATDELYSSLGKKTDKFVEILLGKFGNRANLAKTKSIPIKDMNTPEEFKREINRYKSFLVGLTDHPTMKLMSNTDLLNIRDDIMGDMNQFLYLATMS